AAPQGQRRLGDPGPLYSWRPGQPVGVRPWRGGIRSIAFAPGGRAVAIADDHRTVQLWDEAVVMCRAVLRFAAGIRCVAFAPPDGGTLAVATGRSIELWDALALRRRSVCQGHRADAVALAFSPDGRTLLSGGADRAVRLWDVGGGKELAAW